MCSTLEVSRNGFYNWKKDRQVARRLFKAMITKKVIAIHKDSYQTYGSPRITQISHREGSMISRQYVARIMQSEGIRASAAPRFVVTTDSNHNNPIAENLLDRNFTVHELGKVWIYDIRSVF